VSEVLIVIKGTLVAKEAVKKAGGVVSMLVVLSIVHAIFAVASVLQT